MKNCKDGRDLVRIFACGPYGVVMKDFRSPVLPLFFIPLFRDKLGRYALDVPLTRLAPLFPEGDDAVVSGQMPRYKA